MEKTPLRDHTGTPGSAEARLRVIVLDRIADLEAYLPGWTTLAAAAVEANIFYEPWVLLPALRAFAQRADLALVLVLGEPPGPPRRDPAPELWGLFPLERCPPRPDVALSHFRLWSHDYSYLPVPLVHRAWGKEVLGAFFDWLERQKRTAPLLEIESLPVGEPFSQLLIGEVARRKAYAVVHDRWTRALLAPTCDAETYQEHALNGKHRKEIRRQRKRLGEMGDLTFVELGPNDDIDIWLDEFLRLEGSGWKGREGTALESRVPDAHYFREMARGCHRVGRLGGTAIRLDGRPLAMQILLRSGRGAFAFKIGYDEEFARYSPGVMLELDLVERVINGQSSHWIDSSATRNHPMINRLWTERRSVESWLIGTDATTGLLLSLLPFLQWGRRQVDRLLKKSRP